MEGSLCRFHLITVIWVFKHVTHTEVHNFGSVSLAYQYVLGLDIAVDDSLTVQVIQPICYISHAATNNLLIKIPLICFLRRPKRRSEAP